MAEIRTVTTLTAKRDEIAASVRKYEKLLEQARADLAHVTATIAIFEANGDPSGVRAYVNVNRMFGYGEQIRLCYQALANGPQTTRQLALHIMQSKGLDTGDKVLAKGVANRLIHALRREEMKGKLTAKGRVKAAMLWELPPR